MNFKIPEDIRRRVIQLWLEGNSRKDIALICGVSEGTVCTIVVDWKEKLDEGDAEALRELGINLKRSGIDSVQISIMLRKMEVNDDEEEIESFVSQIYQRCLRISGLTSDDIG